MSASELAPIGRELADPLLIYLRREGGLDDEMLEGTWVIALAASGSAGRELLDEVLSRQNNGEDTPLLRRILDDLPRLPQTMQERQGIRLLTLMNADPQAAVERLEPLDEEHGARVIATACDPLIARARSLAGDQRDGEDAEAFQQRRQRAQKLADALDHVLDGLIERGVIAHAEALALVMLNSLGSPGRDSVEQRLDSLGPIDRTDLTEACLKMAETCPSEQGPPWLNALDPGDAWSIGDGERLLEVARELGIRAGKDEIVEPDLTSMTNALERLRGGHRWSQTLDLQEVIPAADDLRYDQFESKLQLVAPLLDLDLLDRKEIAGSRAIVAARELRRGYDPSLEHPDEAGFVLDTLSDVLETLQPEAFEDVWDAFQATAWITGLDRARLLLMFTLAAERRGLSVSDTADIDTVQAYIATHGADLDEEIGQWLALDPGNESIHKVLDAYAPRLPAPMLHALREISAGADPQRRLQLCTPLLDTRPGELLEALGFPEADQQAAAELLIKRYRKASKNEQREQVLLLWRALRPTHAEARRRLIQEVMIPMATENGKALDYVLREIDLARDPPRTKNALRAALREGAKKFKREKQVRTKLEDLGWVKRSGRFGLRLVDID